MFKKIAISTLGLALVAAPALTFASTCPDGNRGDRDWRGNDRRDHRDRRFDWGRDRRHDNRFNPYQFFLMKRLMQNNCGNCSNCQNGCSNCNQCDNGCQNCGGCN